MKWSKQLLFLAVLLFCLSVSSLSADVVLTDEEYQQIETALTNSSTELQQAQSELEKLKNQLIMSQKAWEMQSQISTTLLESYEMQRTDQIIENVIVFLGGAVVGFAGGVITGVSLE